MISDLVRILLKANTPHDVIIEAIKSVEQLAENDENLSARQLRNKRYYTKQSVLKRLKASETSYSDATPPNGSDGFPHPSLTSLTPPKENTPKGVQKKVPQVLIPDWIPSTEWEAFKQMRIKIKKPLTPYAEVLAIGKLEKFRARGHDPTDVLNQSILNDYQDLYEPKGTAHATTSQNTYQNHRPSKTDRAKAAVLRAAEAGGFAPEPRGQEATGEHALSVLSEP